MEQLEKNSYLDIYEKIDSIHIKGLLLVYEKVLVVEII